VSVPGLVIGAPRSGSGKTTITLGILRALARRGAIVAPAKCGPDYIDTAFHRRAAGRDSVNLDAWAMRPEGLAALATANAVGADLVVAEALMGFFDGVPAPAGRSGSSADVAAALGWPLVLVLDVSGQAQTAAAIAHGFALYDARIALAGVVLNKVGSERHRRLAADAIEARGIPVLGCVPRSDSILLPERHLGLVQAEETDNLDRRLDAIADLVAGSVDLARLQSVARPTIASGSALASLAPPGQRIAVARDAAFSFLYPHLVTGWREAGADITFFSPLVDEPPPAGCNMCWLPGGYPELHAGRLAANARFLDGLRAFAKTGAIHGECGGYMVLGEGLVDAQGARHAMAGLLGLETNFATRRLHLGYRQARLRAEHALGSAGTVLRGHEFHYASILSEAGEPFADVTDAYGAPPTPAGLRRGRVSGSFFHAIAEQ
jgi:cobyrinic acid a,c-diamide synthase